MEHITFDKLLLKTAFCCMACDGTIDAIEIKAIKSMCEKFPLFKNFNFQEELNAMVTELNEKGKDYLTYYFGLLSKACLSEEEELKLIEFAISTLKANEELEYSEIKFFKVIRSHLKISNDKVLEVHPDIELYLQEDIITDSYLDSLKTHFIESVILPDFENIKLPGEDK